MVMSSKKIGRMVDADVDKALANISASTPKPDMKGGDEEFKKATGPSRDMTFGESFKYARMAAKAAGMDPSKETFTYKGKTYSTRMAGEGASKSKAASPKAATPKAAAPKAATTKAPEVNARTKEFFSKTPLVPTTQGQNARPTTPLNIQTPALLRADSKAAKAAKEQADAKKAMTAARDKRRETASRFLSNIASLPARIYTGNSGSRNKPLLLVGDEAREANRRQGTIGGMKKRTAKERFETGTLFNKAKGGKIDGIAIRGKTRAPMKKGK